MKLAILSGTFDPIHNAHISIAEYVKEFFGYDKILLVPAFNPPFKENTSVPEKRMDMAKLAVRDLNWIEVSDIEFELGGKSYSVLTLKELYKNYDIDGKIGFIIGTDAYRTLHRWYEAEELKKLADFIVFERGFPFDDEEVKLRHKESFNMIKTKMPFVDISSTEIRKKVKNGLDISKFVQKDVERYIKENGLYK